MQNKFTSYWPSKFSQPFNILHLSIFTIHRMLYACVWPVCTLATTYAETFSIVKDYFSSFSESHQQKFFGDNAIRFYNLRDLFTGFTSTVTRA